MLSNCDSKCNFSEKSFKKGSHSAAEFPGNEAEFPGNEAEFPGLEFLMFLF